MAGGCLADTYGERGRERERERGERERSKSSYVYCVCKCCSAFSWQLAAAAANTMLLQLLSICCHCSVVHTCIISNQLCQNCESCTKKFRIYSQVPSQDFQPHPPACNHPCSISKTPSHCNTPPPPDAHVCVYYGHKPQTHARIVSHSSSCSDNSSSPGWYINNNFLAYYP